MSDPMTETAGQQPDTGPATAPQPAPLDAIETRAHYYDLLSHQIGNSHAPDLVKAAHACADDVSTLLERIHAGLADLDRVERDSAADEGTHDPHCWMAHPTCLAARIRATLTGEDHPQ